MKSKSVESLFTHRVGVHAIYFKIAKTHAARYREMDAEIARLEKAAIGVDEVSEHEYRVQTAYSEREQAGMVSVTFAGMALEAFFYDYAAENLGDEYVQAHLDRLDLLSKFVLYPRLISGDEPDRNGRAYHSLRRLISLRNDLVHFKSKSFPIVELYRAADYHEFLNKQLKSGVGDSISCVLSVMDELDRLHKSNGLLRGRMTSLVEPDPS